jgi:hypothetical protein
MANEPHLEAVTDRQGICAGIHRCSVCNAEFSSSPNKPGELALAFNVHVEHVHTAKKRKPREDVNQAAARIVREATEKD